MKYKKGKRLQLFMLSCLLVFCMGACQSRNGYGTESEEVNIITEHEEVNSGTEIKSSSERFNIETKEASVADTSEDGTERRDAVGEQQMITMQVAQETVQVILYENESTKAFRKKLPMTIQMDEMNGNEKYYFMEESIPSASESIGNINAGDFFLFGSDCLVLFFEDFETSYAYTRLGYVENALDFVSALSSGSVEVTFSMVE